MWITNNTPGPFRTPTFVPQFHNKGQICQIMQGLRKKVLTKNAILFRHFDILLCRSILRRYVSSRLILAKRGVPYYTKW